MSTIGFHPGVVDAGQVGPREVFHGLRWADRLRRP
jgi:hypothetical protein